jgi:hypothetical protein
MDWVAAYRSEDRGQLLESKRGMRPAASIPEDVYRRVMSRCPDNSSAGRQAYLAWWLQTDEAAPYRLQAKRWLK